MDFYPLTHFIPRSCLEKSIIISESIHMNADFLLVELSSLRSISTIFTLYQNYEHYTKLFNYFNRDTPKIVEFENIHLHNFNDPEQNIQHKTETINLYTQNTDKGQEIDTNNYMFQSTNKFICIDDYYTYRKLYTPANINSDSQAILIFRSGTCCARDYYNCELLIEVKMLDSGVCRDLDGRVVIRSRDGILANLKYKVKNGSVMYTQ